MKLAFLIQAHKNLEQLSLLIDYLKKNSCDSYVHIDKKNKKLQEELMEKYKNVEGIYILDKTRKVNWSGFSQVEATLDMMKLANQNNYDYISLISGQDLLIRPVLEFKEFLNNNKGKNFIEFEDIGNKRWRLEKYSFFRENPNNRKISYRILDNIIRRLQPKTIKKNTFYSNLDLYFGSQWFTITGEAVNYILKEISNIKKDEFRYASCPDEHIFQIILLNSEFKSKCINNNLRYIDWHDCKNSPKTLEIKDFERLKFSSNFIARKFDLDLEKELIKKIYCEIEE